MRPTALTGWPAPSYWVVRRIIAGYTVFLGDPSATHTALALRQAVRLKADPGWAVCRWPSASYSDNGADFTSDHIAQFCAGTV